MIQLANYICTSHRFWFTNKNYFTVTFIYICMIFNQHFLNEQKTNIYVNKNLDICLTVFSYFLIKCDQIGTHRIHEI